MNTYIALFRGINVGGNNLLPMQDLVRALESMGYENIQTYIQSGNVIFQSKNKLVKQSAEEIGKEILKKHGFEPRVLLLDSAMLRETIKNNPYPIDTGKALHFFFLESRPDNPNLAHLELLKSDTEEFTLHKGVFYLYAPDGVGRSKLAAAVEKSMGVHVTARNWNTVNKLATLIEKA